MENRERIRLALMAYHLNPTEDQLQKCVADIEGLFGPTIAERQEMLRKKVWAWNLRNGGKYDASILDAFLNYWNFPLPNGKLRYESTPNGKFSIGGRLATFAKNQVKIDTNKRIAQFKRASGQINPLY